MPCERESEKLIPRMHRRKFEDTSMFFFVAGQRTIMPAITVEKALYNYFKYIGEDNYNIESSLATFSRLQKEYYENSKT